MFWNKKTVLVTGGNGFLGKHLCAKLSELGCVDLYAPSSKMFDLRCQGDIQALLASAKPDIVIHLAAICGGIEANRLQPGKFFYDNAVMGIQLIEEARKAGVKKFVAVGTICVYPKFAKTPFMESELWEGYPEETNAPYGMAKKMLLVQLRAYREQYGFNGVYLLPVNLYGPGDNFDLVTSHVIPAMIRKMIEAKKNGEKSLTLWGTGNVSREFFYVEDCVDGIIAATENYDSSEPVNLGTGVSITINSLAHLIARETGFDGEIIWDSSKPDGQPLRQLDVTKARNFGFTAKTPFIDGLRKTIQWYQNSLTKS